MEGACPYVCGRSAHSGKPVLKLCGGFIGKGNRKDFPRESLAYSHNSRKSFGGFIVFLDFSLGVLRKKLHILIAYFGHKVRLVSLSEKQQVSYSVAKHSGFARACACDNKHCALGGKNSLSLLRICSAEILLQRFIFQGQIIHFLPPTL